MTEKRKLRIVRMTSGKEVRTLTTYRKFKKKYPAIYDRKARKYSETIKQVPKQTERIPTKKKTRKEEQARLIPEKIRKQVVLNLRSHEDPYAVSVRALTINPEINQTGLKMAIIETLNELNMPLEQFWKKEFGYEQARIPEQEDKRLNDMKVHVEIFIRKQQPINFIK